MGKPPKGERQLFIRAPAKALFQPQNLFCNKRNGAILGSSGRVRLGLSFTTAGSCFPAWPIRETELTRSDTRLPAYAWGSEQKVATHPVAQLKQQDNPDEKPLQMTHRSLSPRTHPFHTIYDATGKLVGEYSTIVQSGSNAQIAYTTNDHLGSPRITTGATGQIISRHDFMPFGEEIARVTYGSDSVRKKFTGYERDNETNLDYAKARMYGQLYGRFTSPDPLATSAKRLIPQSWNRYSYVLNNPLVLIDPSGMMWGYYIDGNGHYHMHYFKGNAGKYNGHSYRNYAGPMTLENTNVGRIKLLSSGGYRSLGSLGASNPQQAPRASASNTSRPSSGGYVNQALIKELATRTEPIPKTVGILMGGSVAVGAVCVALCPAAAELTLLHLAEAGGGIAAEDAIVHPEHAAEAIESVEQLLNTMENVSQLTSKTQGFVQGDAQQIFNNITQGGTKITDTLYKMPDGTFVKLYNSSTTGGASISINQAGQMTSVRITP